MPIEEPKRHVSEWVLDASALMAIINEERGANIVRSALEDGAAISAVNLSEIVAKLIDYGMPTDDILAALSGIDFAVESLSEDDGLTAGFLRLKTREAGLSLGDRSCLALGFRLGLPVLTADRPWLRVPPLQGVDIRCIR